MRVVGVDVGARRLHAVALDEAGAVVDVEVFDAAELEAIIEWTDGAAVIAIDSRTARARLPTPPRHR